MTRAQAVLQPYRWLIALCVVYAAVRLAFTLVAGSRGLLSPDGGVAPAEVALGFAALLLRGLVLIAVPGIAIYRVVDRALARLATRPAKP